MGFFETVKAGYKIMGHETAQWTMKNRANILTGVNVLGTIATAIISGKDTAKSIYRLREKGIEQKDLDLKEKIKQQWKDYIPTAASVVVTSAAGIGSNRVSAKDLAEMTALYTGTRKLYDEYKKASKEVLEEKEQKKIQEQMAENARKELTEEQIRTAPHMTQGGPEQLFCLGWCSLPFYSTKDKVDLAFEKCRRMMSELAQRGPNKVATGDDYPEKEVGVALKELLAYLGFQESVYECRAYNHIGWNKGCEADGSDDDEIDYTLDPGVAPDGEHTCWVISFIEDPSDMSTGWNKKVMPYFNGFDRCVV